MATSAGLMVVMKESTSATTADREAVAGSGRSGLDSSSALVGPDRAVRLKAALLKRVWRIEP
eukprot:scaffold164558_cov51-Attheya_sp.AAC.1